MAGQIPNVATSATTHSGLGFLPLDRSPSSPSSLASEQTTTRSSSTSLFSLSSPRSTLSSISDSSEQASPPSSTRASSLSDAILGPLGNFLASLWVVLFGLLQNVIIYLFAPNTDAITLEPSSNPLGRIAIIGAGITGISSAAHFLAHGFEVVIFEQSETIGGIWSRVNSTSSLQLDSLMYRFHPSVKWSNQFPVRKGEILSELQKVWNNYRLSSRTRLNFTVEQVSRQEVPDGQPSKWTINNGVDGVFDGILVAVGTCGPAERVKLEGRERFQGKMVHSSELDQIDWPGKRVVVIGGGASAVEALELAVQSGCTTPAVLVTRTDKWFIPRNLIIGTLLAMNPFGVPCFIDNIAEGAIRAYHYGADLKWMSPAAYNGKPADRLYSKTPIVNGEFLKLVRENRADYVRAKINGISPQGVEVQRFGLDQSEVVPADVIVEATGYKRPYLGFLPTQKLFRGEKTPGQYAPPNLFLQHFAANDWTCLMTNVGYYEGIGTVGHNHIGILARMMMMFMLDDKTAPTTTEMRSWVDRVVKVKGSLAFFTYAELSIWMATFLISNPRRWSWLPFVGMGWGGVGAQKVKAL
ncbi:hypothetical protein MJO29_013489 [Puccinia striiformis f. sp. tritici]|uniref:FAD/NAD(P)-binding domain-containing protein n=3 Tax=Puccinia striiformis TaxID=27350 RepID=A0A0L0VWL3_9BASI|nr:hypothetical protein Pst134EA_025849 [Puccinia striiformis f. sp. tritici]KNF03658.1 hypothetical protein PSTG_03179 [Puccinia striiformis f. sp. tritici PST-78]KAH9444032.1 hypothetical protein Pst134EB_026420 [Puccinia striiformis f. sp. tritici]KAH9451911.1 hypothetical protein Pst134EA_025849 [Puccinia striiformis f. sp. tritici]KAI7941415.1 hypothetical protein MJO29_013489 [Puccinia striiformis f. sp. tritici]KNF03679.1 hypothetical protein PSTG_03199 [Puccinia striiformis f. sp. trit